MRKSFLILGIVMVIVTNATACQFKESISKEEEVNNSIDSSVNPSENEMEIMPIIDNADEWSRTLLTDGILVADLNGDMVSIVSFNEEQNSFIVEESWLEEAR